MHCCGVFGWWENSANDEYIEWYYGTTCTHSIGENELEILCGLAKMDKKSNNVAKMKRTVNGISKISLLLIQGIQAHFATVQKLSVYFRSVIAFEFFEFALQISVEH